MDQRDAHHDWIKVIKEQLEEMLDRNERLEDQGRIDPELRAKISELHVSLAAADKFCQNQDKAV